MCIDKPHPVIKDIQLVKICQVLSKNIDSLQKYTYSISKKRSISMSTETTDKKMRSTYTTDELEKIASKLKALPAIEKEKQKHSKQDAINYLRKEIIELQKKGYSLINISDTLKGEGIDISTPTLRNYLTRSKTAKNSKIAKSDTKINKQPKSKKAERQDTPPAPPLVLVSENNEGSNKGTFSVRADRKDI
jgi:hypothetical protein